MFNLRDTWNFSMAIDKVSLPSSSLLVLHFLISWFSIQFLIAAGTSTLFQGQVFTRLETIVSDEQNFELGFFYPGKSGNGYVGIWYKQIPIQTVVWVANRGYALTNPSPQLKINEGGNLVIVDGRITYAITDVSTSGNTSATLLYSGNLVLRDIESNELLWQSFDEPSNMFLPGMKLGFQKNGKNWSFTSWKGAEDPGVGDAQLRMDPESPSSILIMQGTTVWRTGFWTGREISFFPSRLFDHVLSFVYVSNPKESYLTYSLGNSSTVGMFTIEPSGRISMQMWIQKSQQWGLFWSHPQYECELYGYCGRYSICRNYTASKCQCLPGFELITDPSSLSNTCTRRTPLKCDETASRSEESGFYEMNHVKLHYNVSSVIASADSCRLACLNKCFCTGYSYSNGKCYSWKGKILNLEQLSEKNSNGTTIYIKLAASELRQLRGRRSRVWLIPTTVGIAAITIAISILCYRYRKKQREAAEKGQDMLLFDIEPRIEGRNRELSGGKGAEKSNRKDVSLPMFSFASVCAATNNFCLDNKLGQGGFGPVYKGKLLSGKLVAVKRLSKQSGQGLEEFKNETLLIANLQHRNLVRLLGCCVEDGEKILIYEYMPNKSLDTFLFGSSRQGFLDWPTRISIIEGIAQGLLYLHRYSRLKIIHRDLKASNILLDNDMNPKISDFGMARMFGGNQLQENTNHIVGTYGYMSPEYAFNGIFSEKLDVFSFGILLLEIVSGRKTAGFHQLNCPNIITYTWELWNSEEALKLMDPLLKPELEHQTSKNLLLRYINVALLCVQETASDRPTMSEVVSMLTNELLVLPSPKRPAFCYSQESPKLPAPELQDCSINQVTLTMEAR